MKFLIVLVLTIISLQVHSETSSILEEIQYNLYKNKLSKAVAEFEKAPNLNEINQKIFIDALEDSFNDDFEFNTSIFAYDFSNFSLIERLRLEILKIKFNKNLIMNQELLKEVLSEVSQQSANERLIYILAANEKLLLDAGEFLLIQIAKGHTPFSHLTSNSEKSLDIERSIVSDLYFNTPNASSYKNGKYKQSVKVFMFCRKSRTFPCLTVMKDINNRQVRISDTTLWSHPVLALSKHGLPSYERNGSTPAGIFTIDSVMPSADQQKLFGKFRRMVLNFVPKSKNETLLKSFLPKSSWEHNWWSANPKARDIGRSLFRIHGTGEINLDPQTPFYPFIRTSGCIANKENTYDGETYQDQRLLLNSMMMGLNLKPKYENELKIKGILYIIEIDDIPREVTLEDLDFFDIR